MKQKKLSSAIALSICLEMMLSPLAVHADTTNNNNRNNNSGDGFTKALNTATNVINTGTDAYNRLSGAAGNSGEFQGQMAAIGDSSRPNVDSTYNLNTLMRIPGFAEYLKTAPQNSDPKMNPANVVLNCFTMPPKFHETKSEICEMGISPSLAMQPKDQAMEAKAYFNQYLQLSNNYDEFGITPWSADMYSAARGNTSMLAETQKGYGCMKNMGMVLEGFFAYRMNELNKMKTQLAAWTAEIKTKTQADVDQVMRDSAILKGPSHPAANPPLSKTKAGDFDYAKRFGDAACASMLPNNSVNEKGKAGGLLGITKEVVDNYSNPPEAGPYSPKDYLKFSANVEKDIKDMAKQMGQQAKSGFGRVANGGDFSKFMSEIAGEVRTDSGVHEGISKSIFTEIQNSFNEKRNVLAGQLSTIEKEFGAIGVGGEAKEELLKYNNDAVFDSEIATLEDEIKGRCAANSPIDSALGRIHDPKLSKEANKATTRDIKKKISAIMKNVRLSDAAKRQQLKAMKLDRFQVKLDTEHSFNELEGDKAKLTKIGASDHLTPDGYFDTVMKNCEAEFAVQKLNKRMPAKKAIAELRSLKRQYNQLAIDNSKKIEKEIIDKMINCGTDSVKMNSSAEGQCTSARFNLKSPTSNFCAASAKSCARNMKTCSENATKMVDEIKVERKKLAEKYNAFMGDKKKTVVNMFKMNLEKFTKEGEMLRAQFKNKSGFDTPQGIQWEVDENKRYMKGLEADDEVSLEDPAAIVAMFEANIDNLTKQVKQQQEEIMGGDGAPSVRTADARLAEYKKLKGKAEGMATQCNNVYKGWVKSVDESNKMAQDAFDKGMGEFGEKKAAFCGRYSDIMADNPIPGCKDGFGDVTTAMIQAAGKIGNNQVASEASRMRSEMARICGEPKNQTNKDGTSTLDLAKVCALATMAGDKDAIAAVEKYKISPHKTAEEVCQSVSIPEATYCPEGKVEETTGANTKNSTKKDCSQIEKNVVAAYEVKLKYGSGTGQVASNDRWSSGDDSDGGYSSSNFCNASYSAQNSEKGNSGNKSGIEYDGTRAVKR